MNKNFPNAVIIACLLLIMALTPEIGVTSEHLEANRYPFKKISVDKESTYGAPLHIFNDRKNVQWLIFERYIVRKQGKNTKKYQLPGDISDFISKNPLIRSYEFYDTVIFSYNTQLIQYNQITDKFERWENLPAEHHTVTGITSFNNNELWISTLLGLYRIRKSGASWEKISFPGEQTSQNSYIFPYYITATGPNQLIIGSALSKLFRLTITKDDYIFETYPIIEKNRVAIRGVSRISDSELLIATSNGLYQLNLENHQYTKVSIQHNLKNVSKLLLHKNHLWMIADRQLYTKKLSDEEFIKIDAISNFNFNETHYQIKDISIDSEGSLWASIKNKGIYYYSQYLNKLAPVHNQLINQLAANLSYINIDHGRLIASDGNSTIIAHNNSKLDEPVYSTLHNADGSVFFGVSGLVLLSDQEATIKRYEIPAMKSSVTSLAKDRLGRLWAVSSLTGLHLLDIKTGQSQDIEQQFIGKKHQVKFVTHHTDEKITIVTREDIRTLLIEHDPLLIHRTIFKSEPLHSEKKGDYLFIYHKDLSISRYNLNTRALYRFANKHIEDIGCVFNNGDPIWWVTQVGGNLYKINTDTNEIRLYQEKDGIPQGGLSGKWCISDGTDIYFSSFQGLIKSTELIGSQNQYIAEMTITHFSDHSTNSLRSANSEKTNIELDDFPINLHFFNSSLVSPKSNRIRYRLTGLNDRWIEMSGDNQKVSYQILNPGDYQFIIQGSNSDGIWGTQSSVSFKVLPPIWLTWWAKLSYMIILSASLYVIYLIRTNSIRKRSIELERIVTQRTSELEQLLDKKNEEFVNISHEFRTPLTLILGPVQSLLKKENKQEFKNTMTLIKRNGFRLLRLVDQLLHMEKFRVQQIASQKPVQVKPIVKLIGESFADIALEKGIDLQIRHIDDVWLMFTPDALEKILLNLLSNAIKYTQSGGWITLSVRKLEHRQIELKVTDSGIGISVEQQSWIFGRFNRALDNHSEQITGAGIGLALVKELVVNHGGKISLNSQPGKGSSFCVLLPILEVNNHPSDHSRINKANTDIVELEIESLLEQKRHDSISGDISTQDETEKKATLLIVEDNLDMQTYISGVLRDNYRLLLAKNGKEGLSLALQDIPDLIISDLMMPEMDGFELCRSLKEHTLTSHIPLILLTARNDRNSRLQGWKEKADEYLTKPFDGEELIIRVENLLNIRDLLKQRFYLYTQNKSNQLTDNNDQRSNKALNSPPVDSSTSDPMEILEWERQEKQFLANFTHELEKNIENPDFRVETIAKNLAVSERQLYRKLKGLMNVTPADFLRSYRLTRAYELIESGTPVSHIAFSVGFSSHSYFSRCFKAKYGKTPTEFANNLPSLCETKE